MRTAGGKLSTALPLQRNQQLSQGRRVKPLPDPYDPATGQDQFQGAGMGRRRVGHHLHRNDGARVGGALLELAPSGVEGRFSQPVSGTEFAYA